MSDDERTGSETPEEELPEEDVHEGAPTDEPTAEEPESSADDKDQAASKKHSASADKTAGDVVEARIVTPRPGKRLPKKVIAAAAVALTIGGGLFAYDASVVTAERAAFSLAKDQASVEGWQTYLAWAEGAGAWTRNRTPLARHIAYGEERRAVREAYAASAARDRETLCAMVADMDPGAPAVTVAQRSLRHWVTRSAERLAAHASAMNTPADIQQALLAALRAQEEDDVCNSTFTLRVKEASFKPPGITSYPDSQFEQLRASVTAKLTDEVLRELAAESVPALEEHLGMSVNVVARDEAAPDTSVGEIELRLAAFPASQYRLPGGETFRGIGLRVGVARGMRGTGGDTGVADVSYHLAENYGLEVHRAAENGTQIPDLFGLMLDELTPAASGRLGQSIALAPYERTGGARGYLRCRSVNTMELGGVVSGNTRDWSDVFSSTCEDHEYEEYGYNDEYYDDDSIGKPDEGFHFVVPEASQVSVQTDALDFDALIFVQATCGSTASEVACARDLTTARFTAEPGVYTAFVSGGTDEEAGPFRLVSAARPTADIATTCGGVSQTLRSGEPARGRLGRGDDMFDGECGGTGSAEQAYKIAVPAGARVRCRLEEDGDSELILHARTECVDFESEVGCAESGKDLDLTMEDDTELFVFVDGYFGTTRADFELTCTVVESNSERVAGDQCSNPIPITFDDGAAIAAFDLMPARSDEGLQCRSSSATRPASDLVYRFELAERSNVQVRVTGTTRATAAIASRCGSSRSLSCRRSVGSTLDAGTHFVVLESSPPQHFPRGELQLTATPMAPLCADLPLLRGGPMIVPVPPSNTPSLVEPTCATTTAPVADTMYRLRLLHPARVQIVANTRAILMIQRGCASDTQELVCSPSNSHSIDQEMMAGDYVLVVQGSTTTQPVPLTTTITRLDADGRSADGTTED